MAEHPGAVASTAPDLVDVACAVCGRDDARPLFGVAGLQVVACRACGHRYVSPRPTREVLDRIYGEDYFENPAFRTGEGAYYGYADYFEDRDNVEALHARVLGRIEQLVERGRLLDVGCGPGFFVDLARRCGWDAAGVELNEHAVDWAHRNGNDHVTAGTVEQFDSAEPFDCVTLLDVIEHVEDPRAQLEAVNRLVRPGGVVVVLTPDAGSPVSRAMGRHWMEVKRAPEHLHFFNASGMARLLDQTGFVPLERHSIGKITTVHQFLGHLKFSAPRVVGTVDRWVTELGWDEARMEIDPATKMCLYARKVAEPRPPSSATAPAPPRVSRRAFRAAAPAVTPAPPTAAPRVQPTDGNGAGATAESAGGDGERFRAAQHRYWEARERFRDPRSPGPTAFAQPKLDWAEQHLDIGPDTEILDVGAGNGTVTWHLEERSKRVAGLDFSRNLLLRAPNRQHMVQGDAAALPFPDDRFDIVVESNFLHHVADPVGVLREMARVSRRHLLLIEPNRFHPPMTLFMALSKPDWRGLRFDMNHLDRLVGQAGLRLVAAAPQGAVYPNATPARLLPLLSRFDRPNRLGAYIVAVVEKGSQS